MTTRRMFFRSGVALGVASLATGLAPGWLRDWVVPEASGGPADKATILLLATSSEGDPLNTSTPGSYSSPKIQHPVGPEFIATAIQLGAVSATGGQLWAELPPDLRDRLGFVHHRTGGVAHSDYDRVMRLGGAVKRASGNGEEMLATAIAEEIYKLRPTVQADPICLGPERLTVGGAPLSPLRPTALKALFAKPTLGDLRKLRDTAVDGMYAELKVNGTRAQRAFFDQYVRSRESARSVSEQLSGLLANIGGDADALDGAADQVIAAVALASLNIAPVITIHLPFGGDNHQDPELVVEAEETIAGVKHIKTLWDMLGVGLKDEVTFAAFNIFGRQLDGVNGRSHNPDHNVMVMFGPHVQGGVAGGLDDQLHAAGFDPKTGAIAPDGVLPADSAAAAGLTLMLASGVDPMDAIKRIPDGVAIEALLRPT